MMIDTNEDIQYKDVIDTLKSLQEIKSPHHFEADLMRKINSGIIYNDKTKKRSFLDFILSPSGLIPSAGIAVVVGLFIFNLFISEPTQNINDFVPQAISSSEKEDGILLENNIQSASLISNNRSYSSVASTNKSVFSYKPIYMSDKKRAEVQKLKERAFRFAKNTSIQN